MTPPTGWVVARPERDDNKIIWVSVCQYDYDTGGASDGSEPQPDKKPTPAHPRVTKTRNVLTKLRELMTQRLTQQGEIESYVIGGREVRTMTVREHAALIRDYEGRLDTALLSATGRPYRLH